MTKTPLNVTMLSVNNHPHYFRTLQHDQIMKKTLGQTDEN